MPLPILVVVGGALLAGGAGALFHVNARDTVKESTEKATRAYRRYRGTHASYEGRRMDRERSLAGLGEARLSAHGALRRAAEFLRKARVTQHDLEKLDLPREELRAWETISIDLGQRALDAGKSAIAGAAAASGAYALVGMFGTASTGAAISGLSGAAATPGHP